jgi:hypothetical protein
MIGMDKPGFGLFAARALHLHKQDRADIAPAFAFILTRGAFKSLQPLPSSCQRYFPAPAGQGSDIHWHLYHALALQLAPGNLDEDVRPALRMISRVFGRCGQFQHKPRVEAIKGLERQIGNSALAFVHDNDGAHDPHGVAHAGLYHRPRWAAVAKIVD